MKKLFILLILLFSFSCAKKVYPDQPQQGVFPERPEAKESKLILPLLVNVNDLENKINSEFPLGNIYSTGRVESGNSNRYWIDIIREQKISFAPSGEYLRASIPLKVKAKLSKKLCAGYWRGHWRCVGASHTQNARTETNVRIDLIIKPKLNPDYSADVDLIIDAEVVGNANLTFHLLGFRFSISIKSILEKKLNDFIRDKQPEIKKAINDELKKINLKEEIRKYWKELGKPIKIKETPLFINSNPIGLYFQNIQSSDGKMKISLGIGLKINIGDIPKTYNNKLPNLTIISPGDQGQLKVDLPISSTFKNLSSEIKKEIVGQTIKYKKYKFKIEDIDFTGTSSENEAGILSTIKFKCKRGFLLRGVRGKIHLKIIPAYNKTKDSIYVQSFNVTPETNNLLINKSVSFLTNKFFYKDIMNKLGKDFTLEKENAIKNLQGFVEEYDIGKLKLRGKVKEANFNGIYINKETLEIYLSTIINISSDPIIID